MRRAGGSALTAVILLLLFGSCTGRKEAVVAPPQKSDYTEMALRWADSAAMAMTDRELAGQLLMPSIFAKADRATLRQLHEYADSLHVGGIMFLKGDTASAALMSDELRRYCPVEPLIAIDAEWGLGMRLADAPSYAAFSNIPDSVSDVDMYDYGYDVGLQARRLGINTIFGPVLDVASVRGSVMAYRSLGADAQRVAALGTAYARGLEDASVISVAKHFPGLGATLLDSHKGMPVSEATRAQLDTLDLLPFRRFAEAGLSGIMVGHVAMTALDSTRRSAAVSPVVITDLLRREFGFEGLIFTDAMNMKGLGPQTQPAVNAILAGADILVAPDDTRSTIAEILNAMNEGTLPRDTVRNRVRKILFYKYSRQLKNP